MRQEPQLGTGHAVQQALPHLERAARTLVLYGDVPLVGPETLTALLAPQREGRGGADRGARLPRRLRPHHAYGARQRYAASSRKGCDPEQRRIREVNTGIMALPARAARGVVEGG